MTPVKSSNIEAIGYDAATKRLSVKFKSGATWHYDGVSDDEYCRLMEADSIGLHFATHIRKSFRGVQG